MTEHRGQPGRSSTPPDYRPKHREQVAQIKSITRVNTEPKHRATPADPVPCKHHLFMLMCRLEQVDPCDNLSEPGSLYCADHQTHPQLEP